MKLLEKLTVATAVFTFSFPSLGSKAFAAGAGAVDDCPEIRLDLSGGPMEHVPVTFQGHVGICYAHAASEMIDAYRFSHPAPEGDSNTDHLTASLEVAVGVTHEQTPTVDFDDGAFHICPSIGYLKRNGSADENWVSELYSANGIQRLDFDNALRQYQAAFQAYEKKAPKNSNPADLAKGFSTQTQAALQNFGKLASPEARVDLPAADSLIKIAARPSFTDAMYDFLEPYSENKPRQRVSSEVSCHESKAMNGKQIFAAIHTLLLAKNAQPIAIKMCRNIFEQGHSYIGVTGTGFRKDCLLHWPLIIGEKKIGNSCRFLVRNSMGTGDSGYSTDWLPREHGSLWIDENTLINNTLEMSYLGDEN